jgi:CheY-like chemotaxis protein
MTKYLYIDDEAEGAESFAEALVEANHELSIKIGKPESLEQIIELLSTNPDGLLLDVKLSNTKGKDNKPLPFDGIGLAQQLRSLQTRGQVKSLPIIRLSQPAVIKEFVRGDSTSDDCFDERISKDEIAGHELNLSRRLLSLANDYPGLQKYLESKKTPDDTAALLGISQDFLDRLDSRILSELQQSENVPAHVIAGFFLDKLLARPGPLINEDLLAARLGVDRSQSRDWSSVLKHLERASYDGPFNQGYPRWWMATVTDIWEKLPGFSIALPRARAEERVELLRKALGITLQPIAELADSPGGRYWAICAATALPVDPAFGVPLLPRVGHQPWHDAEYLSLEAALRDSRNSRIRPDDKARLQRQLKKREKN